MNPGSSPMPPERPSPFDAIQVRDPDSLLGRITNRLKGYHPSPTEMQAMSTGARQVITYTFTGVFVGSMLGTFISRRFLRPRGSSFGMQTAVAVGLGLGGAYVGAAKGGQVAAVTVMSVPGSTFATVVKEECAEEKRRMLGGTLGSSTGPLWDIVIPETTEKPEGPAAWGSRGAKEEVIWGPSDQAGMDRTPSAPASRKRTNQWGDPIE
ncbi:hypothetical protein HDV05_001966 [Chytridiales sp. JEL 0842]|nr:hypothetical protein HDV05_001966 [Chytridiales sp. JEL 0842]